MRTVLPLICGGILLATPTLGPAQTKNDTIAVKTVTYEELGTEIVKHRGKVVVIDIWFPG